MTITKPATRPDCAHFSSGPCAKIPGWEIALSLALLGLSAVVALVIGLGIGCAQPVTLTLDATIETLTGGTAADAGSSKGIGSSSSGAGSSVGPGLADCSTSGPAAGSSAARAATAGNGGASSSGSSAGYVNFRNFISGKE